MDRFGTGGLVKITDGGLNQNHATINFISEPGQPMTFSVIINGYCVQLDTVRARPVDRPTRGETETRGWNDNDSVLTFNTIQNPSGWWSQFH